MVAKPDCNKRLENWLLKGINGPFTICTIWYTIYSRLFFVNVDHFMWFLLYYYLINTFFLLTQSGWHFFCIFTGNSIACFNVFIVPRSSQYCLSRSFTSCYLAVPPLTADQRDKSNGVHFLKIWPTFAAHRSSKSEPFTRSKEPFTNFADQVPAKRRDFRGLLFCK